MVTIMPEGWYEEFYLREHGFPEAALRRAREKEGLQSKEMKGATFYKGEWLLSWLEGRKPAEVARK